MGMESYQLGREGEANAETYLRQKNFEILERNFRSQQGEIDLIARDQAVLVFVEVKNYSYRSFGAPQAAIRKNKRASIVHAARYYLYLNKLKNIDCRFDVLAIHRRPDGSRAIEHYKNAFTIN
jgi:putative endonuclease